MTKQESTPMQQRDLWAAHAQAAWQENAELRQALTNLNAAYTLERDSLYDCATNDAGEYDDDDTRRAVAEMDAILDATRAVLARVRK